MRHVHYIDETGKEHIIPVKNKSRAYMEYHNKKRAGYDEVRVTDNEGEYCAESEL